MKILASMLGPGISFPVLLPGRLITDTNFLPDKLSSCPSQLHSACSWSSAAEEAMPDTLIHSPKISAWPGYASDATRLENITSAHRMLYLFVHIGCSRPGSMPSTSLGLKPKTRLKDTAPRPGKSEQGGQELTCRRSLKAGDRHQP